MKALLALIVALALPALARAEAAGPTPQAVISGARLAEPLVRTGSTSPAEDADLASAVTAFARRAGADDYSALAGFAARHPHSGWTSAVETNLGLLALHDGYFSRAIADWRQAWADGRNATEPHAHAMVDQAVSQLAWLYASLGQFGQLRALVAEVGKRPITGSATEKVQAAADELNLVTKDPRHLFNCGPVSVAMLIQALDPKDRAGDFLVFHRSSPKGTSLAELQALAGQARMPAKVVYRRPGEPVPLPAVVHWKVGHYAAIVGKANGRYHIEEPSFPGASLWVTPAALDSEASGYFLVPVKAPIAPGWRIASAKEAAKVWGKGPTNGQAPGLHPKVKPCGPSKGMCVHTIDEGSVGVMLSDSPVGYAPPVGPAPKITLTYNQREDSQPANFSFFNVSQKWTLNWLDYVIDDPTNPGASVSRYLPDGGAAYYSGYNGATGRFAADPVDGSILVLLSTSPITYRRQLADGSVEIYAASNGATAYPRYVFLTEVIDPRGNALTLSYDGQLRLTALTDATGRKTTFSYGLFAQPLLVTQITDHFGRSANLTYDGSGRLSSITDVLGITSSFAYDANSLIDQLTTPYGVTSFAYTAPGTAGPPRFVQVTDPMGFHEREEWLEPAPIPDSDPSSNVPQGMPLTPTNQYLSYRDSFFWDATAYVLAGCTPTGGRDYTKARDTHFNHVPNTSIRSTSIESVKQPLKNRVWYQYPGQTNPIYAGASQRPIAVGRVLDDGTTQLRQYAYDAAGYYETLQAIDPLGRTTSYAYGNQIDLAALAQTTANGVQTTIDQYTYNAAHAPLFATDAASQTSAFAYNPAGQVLTSTNALGQATTFHYDPTGDLTSIVNANALTQASFTYDAFDRVASFTDSEGWSVAYSYDAADRLTKTTYPDGTSETYSYTLLDLASYQDRIGRTWSFGHDADRRLTSVTDPAGHQTLYAYNPIGEVTSRTDPNTNVTGWAYDVEGRLTTKTFPDHSTQTFAYEATTSRLKSVTDALGQVKAFDYAKDDRVIGVSYQNAVHPTPNVTFAWDAYFPRRTSMSDGSGTTTYAYAPVGSLGALHLQTETGPLAAIAYAYDPLGRLASRTLDGQGAETFRYDAIGRLIFDTSDLGSFTLAYLGQTGQIAARSLASSNLATTWTYLTNANDRRLAGIATTGLTLGQSLSFSYVSNPVGQTTSASQTSDGVISYPPGSLTQSVSFNALNQITALNGQAYTYDADGDLTSDGTRTYQWDAENRLIAIGFPGQPGKATSFGYDGLGRRVQWSSTPVGGGSTTVTSYNWCGQSLCQASNASNQPIRGYYAEGELAPGVPATSYYYAPDRVGSVRRVYSTSAATPYDYDPYGNALQATAPSTDYGYAGLINNSDSGLSLATYRPYDPVSSRFLARDPIGEAGDPEGNLYAYADAEPVGGNDPAGLLGPWNLAPPMPPFSLGGLRCEFSGLPGLIRPFLGGIAPKLVGIGLIGGGALLGIGGAALAPESAGASLVAEPEAAALAAEGAAELGLEGLAGTTAEGAAESIPNVTVSHFTSAEAAAAIGEGGTLNAGSFVTTSNLGGLSASEVESALEIEPGKGAFSTTFQTPASNLGPAINGPLTSGLEPQYQLVNPTPVTTFVATPSR